MVMATASLFVLQSTSPATADALQRIANTEAIIAVALAVIALILIGASVVGIAMLRRVNTILLGAEVAVALVKPRVEPIVDALNVMSRDAAALTGAIRGRVDALMRTVDELHAEIRETAADARIRVKQFGAVLDIVQEEAEGLMLDAAATARGVHTTAERLRDPDSLAPLVRRVPVLQDLQEPPESIAEAELLGGPEAVMPVEP
jgi:hypothetical protein